MTTSGHDPYAAPDPYATGDPYASPTPSLPHPGPEALHPGPEAWDPRYGAPSAPPPPTSGTAVASLVLGILGLTLCAGLTAPVGVFLALHGMRQSAPGHPEPRSGRGLAIAGLVTSILGTVYLLAVIAWIALVVLVAATG